MNRTPTVLAAIACAAVGLVGTSQIALADHNRSSYAVECAARDLADAERALDAARYAVRDVEAEHHQVVEQLSDARRELADATRHSHRDRLLEEIESAERALGDTERRLGALDRACADAQRHVERASADYFASAKRDLDYRWLSDHVDLAERDLDAAIRDVLDELECSWDWRAAEVRRDEAAGRVARVEARDRAPDYIADRARRELREAEEALARLRNEALDCSPAVREARRAVDRAKAELDRHWARIERDLENDRGYCAAQRRLDDVLRDKAEADRCVEAARNELAQLRRDLDHPHHHPHLGGSYVSHVDVRAIEDRVRHLDMRRSRVDDEIAFARRDVEQAECEVTEARRDYERALASERHHRRHDDRHRDRDRGNRYHR